MDDLVTIEYRGVLGTLNVGDSFVVESCEAGLLKVRRVSVDYARPHELTSTAPAPVDAPAAAESPTDEAPK